MSDKEQFFRLLDNSFPELRRFWIKEASFDIFDETAVNDFLRVASKGESVTLKALLSIWCGGSGEEFRIDFTDLAALDGLRKTVLTTWILNPIWP